MAELISSLVPCDVHERIGTAVKKECAGRLLEGRLEASERAGC
jgi:hypothetical protein